MEGVKVKKVSRRNNTQVQCRYMKNVLKHRDKVFVVLCFFPPLTNTHLYATNKSFADMVFGSRQPSDMQRLKLLSREVVADFDWPLLTGEETKVSPPESRELMWTSLCNLRCKRGGGGVPDTSHSPATQRPCTWWPSRLWRSSVPGAGGATRRRWPALEGSSGSRRAAPSAAPPCGPVAHSPGHWDETQTKSMTRHLNATLS